jgi:1-acyl-sn-glycerol-3-phosphate acyltransferase
MVLQEILTTAYLLWPITIGVIVILCILGFLFLISISSIIGFSALAFYYGYHWLKKKGFFSWMWRNFTEQQQNLTDSIGTNIRETFFLKGIENLEDKKAYLFLAHPHGLFSMAPFFHWGIQLGHWPSEKPIKIAIHSIFFKIPFVRELMEANHCIEVNEDEIRATLESGTSVVVLTGGVQEISHTEPGILKVVLKKRQGVLRIAKELQAPIVPVLTFGENELFPPLKHKILEKIQEYLHAWFHIALPVPTWESIQNWFTLLRKPLDSPVITYIGKPIYCKKNEGIEGSRKKVISEFERIYKANRPEHYSESLIIL